MNKKVAIIGATSGIGRALAKNMHARGYTVGATGRRVNRLEELKQDLGSHIHIARMDVTNLKDAIAQLDGLIEKMDGLDIIILNAGVSNFKGTEGRVSDLHVIDVNIRGFANLCAYTFNLFKRQGHGQIIGISSIAGLFGWGMTAPYNASKAFVDTYLQGYRQKANHTDAEISVSTIRPGFVKSELVENMNNLFWVSETDVVAEQIVDAIQKRKNEAYITRRWRLVAWLLKIIPNWAWNWK